MRIHWTGAVSAALLVAAFGVVAGADQGTAPAPPSASTQPAASSPGPRAAASPNPKSEIRNPKSPERATTVFGIHIGTARGTGGPVVTQIDPGSPARGGGLRRGDEIVRVDDRPVSGDRLALRLLAAIPQGRDVQLQVRRGASSFPVHFTSPGAAWAPTAALKAPRPKKSKKTRPGQP